MTDITAWAISITGGLAAIIGAVLSVLVARLIQQMTTIKETIAHFDRQLAKTVTRDELDTKMDKLRIDVDRQMVRQEDRIANRIDQLVSGYDDLRTWLTAQFTMLLKALNEKEDRHD